MKKYLEKTAVLGIALLTIVVYATELLEYPLLNQAKNVLIVLVIINCLILAKGASFYLSLISLLVGHFVLFYYHLDFSIWQEGISKNLPLAILLVMVPVLSLPLSMGGYLNAINSYVFKHMNDTRKLFMLLSTFIFFLTSITNLGSLRISHSLLEEIKFPKKFLAKVFVVGFTSCILWSPYFGSVNLVLFYTGVTFNSYFLPALILGIFMLILGNFLFLRDYETQESVLKLLESKSVQEENSKGIIGLVFHLLGLFFLVIIGERFLHLSSMMLLVGLSALLYSFFWVALLKKLPDFIKSLREYDKNILQVKNEIVFFLSVGFFGFVLAETPLSEGMQRLFENISGLSVFVLIEMIIIITALLSCLGIHQAVTVTALGLSLTPELLGLSKITFALTLTASWTISTIFSPFAPYTIMVGGLLKENIFVLGLKWNRAFGASAFLLAGIYIYLVNLIF